MLLKTYFICLNEKRRKETIIRVNVYKMVQIKFRNRGYRENLNAEDCMELFFTIIGDVQDKIEKLDEKTDVSSFIDECDEFGKYLDNGRSCYTEYYTGKNLQSTDIEGHVSSLSQEYIKLDNQDRNDFIKKCIEVEDFASESFQKLSSQNNFVVINASLLEKRINKGKCQNKEESHPEFPGAHSLDGDSVGSPEEDSKSFPGRYPEIHSVHTTQVSSGVEDISGDVNDDTGNLQISRNDYTADFFVAPSAFNVPHSLYKILLNNIIMHPINKPSGAQGNGIDKQRNSTDRVRSELNSPHEGVPLKVHILISSITLVVIIAHFLLTKFTSFGLLFSNKKGKKDNKYMNN
ncbi:hypothetical protein POVWA2_090860 [Plasmodium ovale wallikeri]|uniref:PIR Superfamily Protein n=1 Tax=Plasmodium ovale wallikeri TaxID=864142 RepID=A0A1A9ASE3_PLAOA|nr:hypothetical protein POVWA1_075450 [Plasmodium ovale wallikeri]SBT59039.1 hypothetical protein POVWA2_090860 [Plasmodium ovale wallikeri]